MAMHRERRSRMSLAIRRRRRKEQQRIQASAPLGSGERFRAVARAAAAGGAKNPEAVAASVGRRKFGAKRFAMLAAIARRRKRARQR